jgi:hypothetical protein
MWTAQFHCAMHSSSRLKVFADQYPRRFGAFATLFGGGLLYWMVYLPIQQAQQHVGQVHIYMKGTIVGTALFCFGLLRLAFGKRLTAIFEGSKFASIVLGIFLVGAGFYAHQTLKAYLEAHGYHFH